MSQRNQNYGSYTAKNQAAGKALATVASFFMDIFSKTHIPGSQGRHIASLVACLEGEYVPIGHGVGLEDPAGQ